jgi:hypothetical protein
MSDLVLQRFNASYLVEKSLILKAEDIEMPLLTECDEVWILIRSCAEELSSDGQQQQLYAREFGESTNVIWLQDSASLATDNNVLLDYRCEATLTIKYTGPGHT